MKKVSIITSLVAPVLSGGYDRSYPQKTLDYKVPKDKPSEFGQVIQVWKETCNCFRYKKQRFFRRSLTPGNDEKTKSEPAQRKEVLGGSYDHTPWYLSESKGSDNEEFGSNFDTPTPVDPPNSYNGTLTSTPQYGGSTLAEPKKDDYGYQVKDKQHEGPYYETYRKDDHHYKDYKDISFKDYKNSSFEDYKDSSFKDYKDSSFKDYKNYNFKDYKDEGIKDYKDKDFKDEYNYPVSISYDDEYNYRPSTSVKYPVPTYNPEYSPSYPKEDHSYSSYYPRPSSNNYNYHYDDNSHSGSFYYPSSSYYNPYYPKSSYSSYYPRPTSNKYKPYYPDYDHYDSPYYPEPVSDNYKPQYPKGDDRYRPYHPEPHSDNYPRVYDHDDFYPKLSSHRPHHSGNSDYKYPYEGRGGDYYPSPFSADDDDHYRRSKVTHLDSESGQDYEDNCVCKRIPITP